MSFNSNVLCVSCYLLCYMLHCAFKWLCMPRSEVYDTGQSTRKLEDDGDELTVWAISWAMTRETQYLLEMDEYSSECRRAVSRYSTSPQFSIAPALKSGIATWSSNTKNDMWINICFVKGRRHSSVIVTWKGTSHAFMPSRLNRS